MTTTFAPRRWKVWLLTVCGIYPVLTVLATILAPLIGGAPLSVRLAVIAPMTVAAMVWGVTPLLTRRFHGWLTR